MIFTPTGFHPCWRALIQPVPGRKITGREPKVARPRNLGLNDSIPLGLETVFGATPETATGTGALPGNVPAGRPMAVWGGRTGQRRGVEKSQRDFINQPGVDAQRLRRVMIVK